MSLAQLQARMEGWLRGSYEAHLFTSEESTLGYALHRREPEFIYLRHFFVCTPFRRRGYGRRAFELLLSSVWRNPGRVRLDVLVNNEAGLEFWRSLGFTDYCLTMERLQ